MTSDLKNNLLREIEKLHERNLLSKKIDSYYFEPGMMEYLEKSEGIYNDDTKEIIISFEAKGTRYDGRTEQIEKVKLGDNIKILRDKENFFNSNNFILLTEKGQDVGNMPAELCNVIAPLYDESKLIIKCASVSYVEPISKRNRYANKAILFVELHCKLEKEI